jgi:hypothetical protein
MSSKKQNKTHGKQSKMKQRPNKTKIKNYIRNVGNKSIDRNNFNISTINRNGVYSVEPNENCPQSDWHLCLINTQKQKIHYFLIPSESAVYRKLYFRKDTNRYRLIFEITDKNFRESIKGEHFGKFLEKEYDYEDSDIFGE